MDRYKSILELLQRSKPENASSGSFTNNVMREIHENGFPKRNLLKEEFDKWKFFIGVRKGMAIAASFLVIFFCYQQWDIQSKVSRLEQEIQNQKTPSCGVHFEEISFSNKHELIQSFDDIEERVGKKPLIIEQWKLQYLLRQMDQLKRENEQMRILSGKGSGNSNYNKIYQELNSQIKNL